VTDDRNPIIAVQRGDFELSGTTVPMWPFQLGELCSRAEQPSGTKKFK
jgi:hypothetical protein